ncbi:MAG TPA: DMT family transporter [Chitinophagaceae bacterium]|nr:DMT family transporter [Chitinophagaceae bacterium]
MPENSTSVSEPQTTYLIPHTSNLASGKRNLYIGILLAVISAIIWSGNFIVARGISQKIPPITINFFRWLTAFLLLFPFAHKKLRAEKNIVIANWRYFFFVSFTCIVLFNSFVYIAGHYTSAINMALIGTTSSPVFTIVMAAIFLKEQVKPLRILGLIICTAGIVVLLSQGSFERLLAFRFSQGDWWVLSGSLFFAVYNLLVKRIPAGISPLTFLIVFFMLGVSMLLPLYIWEHRVSAPVAWNGQLYAIVLYLGVGTSLLAYLCWNAAIQRIGSARTSLFGNLIPLFSTVEALLILDEKIHLIHLLSGILVIAGLVIANLRKA